MPRLPACGYAQPGWAYSHLSSDSKTAAFQCRQNGRGVRLVEREVRGCIEERGCEGSRGFQPADDKRPHGFGVA